MARAEPWPPPSKPVFATLREHRRVGRDSLVFMSERLGATLFVWLLIGIALALPATLHLLQRNLGAVADDWRGRPGLSVYFRVDADIGQAHALREQLLALPHIGQAWVVTPEQALNEFRGSVAVADALELLGENPLPASLRATLANDVPAARLHTVADTAAAADGVEEVVVEKLWLQRLAALSGLVDRVTWMLAALFGVGAALITTASVRLAIEARLAELRVQRLVGAATPFIRRPFLYLGAIYGFGGGVIAAMLIAAALLALEGPLGTLFESYGGALELEWMAPTFMAGLLGASVLLGITGAVVAVRQRLRRLEVA